MLEYKCFGGRYWLLLLYVLYMSCIPLNPSQSRYCTHSMPPFLPYRSRPLLAHPTNHE